MQGTQRDFKNELLYSSFGINYAHLPARFRKVRVALPPTPPPPSPVSSMRALAST